MVQWASVGSIRWAAAHLGFAISGSLASTGHEGTLTHFTPSRSGQAPDARGNPRESRDRWSGWWYRRRQFQFHCVEFSACRGARAATSSRGRFVSSACGLGFEGLQCCILPSQLPAIFSQVFFRPYWDQRSRLNSFFGVKFARFALLTPGVAACFVGVLFVVSAAWSGIRQTSKHQRPASKPTVAVWHGKCAGIAVTVSSSMAFHLPGCGRAKSNLLAGKQFFFSAPIPATLIASSPEVNVISSSPHYRPASTANPDGVSGAK